MLKVVLIYSPNCGACRALKPAFEQLEKRYTHKVQFVKTTEATTGNIYAFPTTIFYVGGNEVDRVVGNNPKEIENKINQHAQSVLQTQSRPQIYKPQHRRSQVSEPYKKMRNLYL